jgi:hypothetical protein
MKGSRNKHSIRFGYVRTYIRWWVPKQYANGHRAPSIKAMRENHYALLLPWVSGVPLAAGRL